MSQLDTGPERSWLTSATCVIRRAGGRLSCQNLPSVSLGQRCLYIHRLELTNRPKPARAVLRDEVSSQSLAKLENHSLAKCSPTVALSALRRHYLHDCADLNKPASAAAYAVQLLLLQAPRYLTAAGQTIHLSFYSFFLAALKPATTARFSSGLKMWA